MLAILCPGQGAQHAAMFDVLTGNHAARRTLTEASIAAAFDVEATARGSLDLFGNATAQPLICAYQLAAWAALAPLIPAPTLIAGYSVGELAAHGCAGSLTVHDTVSLARRRAALMDDASTAPAGLLAVRGLTRAKVEALCEAWGTEIAIVNGEEQFIVGGRSGALEALAAPAVAEGATTQRLAVGVAAHTSLLAQASTGFRQALERSAMCAPGTPVVAGISGALVRDRPAAIDTLSRQISRSVLWTACLDAAWERGCRVFLELGPCNGLTRMVRERFPDVAARSLADFRSIGGAADWVAKNA